MRIHRACRVAAATLAITLVAGCSLFGQGHQASKVQTTKVDLNTASRRQLEGLPGLVPADVDLIIKNRPYAKKRDLIDRKVLDQQKFNKIRDDVQVSHPGH
jgi:competence protein ComEA